MSGPASRESREPLLDVLHHEEGSGPIMALV
jgi:hypothetical protein